MSKVSCDTPYFFHRNYGRWSSCQLYDMSRLWHVSFMTCQNNNMSSFWRVNLLTVGPCQKIGVKLLTLECIFVFFIIFPIIFFEIFFRKNNIRSYNELQWVTRIHLLFSLLKEIYLAYNIFYFLYLYVCRRRFFIKDIYTLLCCKKYIESITPQKKNNVTKNNKAPKIITIRSHIILNLLNVVVFVLLHKVSYLP